MTRTTAPLPGACIGCGRAEAAVRTADGFPLLAAYAGEAALPSAARVYTSWLCNDCGTAGQDVAWLREVAGQTPPLTVVNLPGQPNEEPLVAEDVTEAARDDQGEVDP